MNSSIDDGILTGFEQGILTSTAVLANGPTAELALARIRRLNELRTGGAVARSHGRSKLNDPDEPFDVGVHLNLTQGRPLTADRFPRELLDKRGCYPGVGRLFAALLLSPRKWLPAIQAELAAQITWVVDRGVQPSHVNGHQYVELFPGVGDAILELLPDFSIHVVRAPLERRLWESIRATRGVPAWALAHVKRKFVLDFVRRVRAAGLTHADGFFGTAHAGHMTLAAIACRLREPLRESVIEIGVHPGSLSEGRSPLHLADGWRDPLGAFRPSERDLVCSDGLIDLLIARGIGLARLKAGAKTAA